MLAPVQCDPTAAATPADRELVRRVRERSADEAERAREELTRRYQPLVLGRAARMHGGRGAAHDDVVSVAQVGLQKAIDGFDLQREVPFAAYASAKVHGELMRWFRDARYAVHVPRPLHERAMRVRRAVAELEASLHRAPDVDEVAAHLDEPRHAVLEAMAVRSAERTRTRMLAVRLGGTEADDRPDPDLARGLEQLGERERLILYRRYWEGCSQREVGEELACSQAHVSRLERAALEQLREHVAPV